MGYLTEKKIRPGLWRGTYTFWTKRKHKKKTKYRIKATQTGTKTGMNTYKLKMKGKRYKK